MYFRFTLPEDNFSALFYNFKYAGPTDGTIFVL